MRVERLTESQASIVALSEAQARALKDVGQRLASGPSWSRRDSAAPSILECEPYGADSWRIRVPNAIGVISVPDIELVVAPKIRASHLLFLFERSGFFPRMDSARADLESADSLWALFATWYLNALDGLLRKGLLNDYRVVRDEGPMLRGKPLVAPSVRASARGRTDLTFDYELFDEDTPLNRVLRAAAGAVTRSRQLPVELRGRALRAIGQMGAVSELQDRDVQTRPDRVAASYTAAFQLALHILDSVSRGLDAGPDRGWAFLIRTPEMIEEALRRIASEALAESTVISKRKLHLRGSNHSLTPDLAFGNVAVGDVKYKLWAGDWDRADLYQAVTFATGFGVTQAVKIGMRSGSLSDDRVRVGPVTLHTCDWPCEVEAPADAQDDFVAAVRELWATMSAKAACDDVLG